MKTGKTFVGSLAVVISLAATGCAATTVSAGGDRGGGSAALVSASQAGATATFAISPQPTPPEDRPSHFTNRMSRMSARAVVTRSR